MKPNQRKSASIVRHTIDHNALHTAIELALNRKDLECADRIEEVMGQLAEMREYAKRLEAQLAKLVTFRALQLAGVEFPGTGGDMCMRMTCVDSCKGGV